jgi:hypothetical protein
LFLFKVLYFDRSVIATAIQLTLIIDAL